MHRIKARTVRFGVSALALFAGPVLAQDAAPARQPAVQDQSDSALEEIIVTAQKRSENLQRTAVAVTALTADTLSTFAVTDVRRLQDFVPGLRLSTSGPATQISIRGISSVNDEAFGDPAAAFNLDGVYLARPQAPTNILYDLERVEVLRGPQGTLYGRNATAGAINVITHKPDFALGGTAEVEIGDYGLHRETATVNVPLSDHLAVRAAGQLANRDGYVSNGTSDLDTKAGRVHVLWKPDPATSVLLTGDIATRGGLGSQQIIPLTPRDKDHPWRTATPADGYSLDGRNWGTTLNATHDFGGVAATVIAAHRDERVDQGGAGAGAGGAYIFSFARSRQNSIEARLSSTGGGPLVWTAGVYAFGEKQNYLVAFQLNPGLEIFFRYPDTRTTSIASFGQATYSISNAVRLTGGLRYTHDHKTNRDGIFGLAGFEGVGVNTVGPVFLSNPAAANQAWNDLSWKAGVEVDLAEHVLGYANVSKGYKAGGISAGLPPTNVYAPEKLIAYAAGLKGRFLDNSLQFNTEAFYWDYKNYQNSAVAMLPSPPNAPGSLGLITSNAGKARIYGIETETSWRAGADDRFDLNLSYLNGKFLEFDVPGAPGNATGSFAGNRLPHAPRLSGTAGYRHIFALGRGKIEAAAQIHFETRQALVYYYNRVPGDGSEQPAYMMSSASLTWRSPGERYRITGYVKNIENSAVANIATEVESMPGTFYGELDPPRTYGVTLGVRW